VSSALELRVSGSWRGAIRLCDPATGNEVKLEGQAALASLSSAARFGPADRRVRQSAQSGNLVTGAELAGSRGKLAR
jgi:hypothetical protein